MGAALLIVMLLLVAANVFFTLRIWKGVQAMEARVNIPRGEVKGLMSEVERIDYGKLADEVAKAVKVDDADGSKGGNEMSQEEIANIAAAVFKNIGQS